MFWKLHVYVVLAVGKLIKSYGGDGWWVYICISWFFLCSLLLVAVSTFLVGKMVKSLSSCGMICRV